MAVSGKECLYFCVINTVTKEIWLKVKETLYQREETLVTRAGGGMEQAENAPSEMTLKACISVLLRPVHFALS